MSQISQENTCTRIKKETLAQVLSYKFCETSKNTFLYRAPLVAASETRQIILTYSKKITMGRENPC